jgi:hypothetical protein
MASARRDNTVGHGGDTAAVDVVDVARHADGIRDLRCLQHTLDISANGPSRIEDRRVGQVTLVHANSFGKPMAQLVVVEQR